jgi:hypothetical protein
MCSTVSALWFAGSGSNARRSEWKEKASSI